MVRVGAEARRRVAVTGAWRTVREKRYAAGASARAPSDHAHPSGATRPHVPEGGLSPKEGGLSPKGTVPSSSWQLHEKDSSALHAPPASQAACGSSGSCVPSHARSAKPVSSPTPRSPPAIST